MPGRDWRRGASNSGLKITSPVHASFIVLHACACMFPCACVCMRASNTKQEHLRFIALGP